jgi:hypothetical protein
MDCRQSFVNTPNNPTPRTEINAGFSGANKHHKIMKKQYTTFENIGYSVVVLAMFFIGSFAILSVYKLLSLLLGFDA